MRIEKCVTLRLGLLVPFNRPSADVETPKHKGDIPMPFDLLLRNLAGKVGGRCPAALLNQIGANLLAPGKPSVRKNEIRSESFSSIFESLVTMAR